MDTKFEEMELLIAAQVDLAGRISCTVKNLKKNGAAKITPSLIGTLLKLLEEKLAKFERQHDALRDGHGEALIKSDYYKQDYLGQAKNIYAHQRAELLDMKRERSAVLSVPRDSGPVRASPRAILPKIQLPQFTGNYEDWPAFRDLFESIIVKETGLSDVKRFHYLKLSLKGQAESLVKGLTTMSENYKMGGVGRTL
ncbi:uncharacterized protein [Cardiocondyla obscurior]|uniref:uncharacterized protein n=1 Tax=Cardiocondyla obscurior TaxID=286306 RepID=UPI0039657D5F